jgi:para-aminobenzoate synthetase/4-amino-4-deoxychorismate lyase
MIYEVKVDPKPSSVAAIAAEAALQRVRLDCALSPQRVLGALAGEALPFALTGSWAGGGAIIGAGPLAVATGDPVAELAPGDRLATLRRVAAGDPFATLDALPAVTGAPPPSDAVGGGWFGWLGYRLAGLVEQVPAGPPRPVAMPEYHLAYYDHLLRLDPTGQWWFEALVTPARAAALESRRRRLGTLLAEAALAGAPHPAAPPQPLRLSAAAAEAHRTAVSRCRRRIFAGEIFQANLCLRLETAWEGRAGDLLATALDTVQPAYGAAFDTPDGAIASLSPELFLRRSGDAVATAPIKGTIERAADPARAAAARAQLQRSAKDAAEHVMIVDLMRNDIGRVCAYGSVRAPREPTVEPHPGLWHLVSVVRGQLRPGVGNRDLLRATFPPGSVTGAPKVQALRVISELEGTGREVYTGAIGYASPLAGLELNVAIRTLELRRGRLWLGAGGGIVADSDPERELDEALAKARPIAAAVGSSVEVGPVAREHALHTV